MLHSSSDESEVDIFSISTSVGRRAQTSIPIRLHLLTFLSAIGGFLFGYDTGVISGAMLLLRQEFSLSHVWQEMIVSGTVMSACLSALVAGHLADTWGRRPTVILASIMFTVGSFWIGVSGGTVSLFLGRMVVGIGVGLASHVVPLYISECSTADKRGILITMNNVAITGGQLVAAITCGLFSNVSQGWRWMLGLAAVPSLVQLLGFLMMPETPRYLVTRNKMDEAERELSSLRGVHHDIRAEIEDIIISSRSGSNATWRSIISSRVARISISLGCLLQATQQLAGINTVMYYSASILVMAGLPDTTSIWLASLTSSVNFISCVFGIFMISRMTRRKLLLSSLSVVILSLILISISFVLLNSYPNSRGGSIMALLSLCMYLAGFSPGLGTLPWVINSELHPGWCRAQAISLATATNWAVNLLVSSTFLSLVDRMGRSLTFLLYALLTILGSCILAKFLPETKGVSLEETEALFDIRTHRSSNIRNQSESSHYSLLSDE